MTSVQHLFALSVDIALRARTVIATSEQAIVSLAVLDTDSRSVLHGAATLPSAELQLQPATVGRPAPLSSAVPALKTALSELFAVLSLETCPAVLVDVVATAGRPRCCELRFAALFDHRGERPRAYHDELRWLSVDSPAPFFTTDWAVLCAALQDILADPRSAVELVPEPHRQAP